MTNSAQDHAQQKPETVEDLAPREDETAELKGGSFSWGDRAGTGRKAGGDP